MRIIVAMILLLTVSSNVFSQQHKNEKITGKILNGDSKLPVEYATVIVTDVITGKTISGAVANNKGVFDINGLSAGRFKVIIDFIGYEKKIFDSVVLTNARPVYDLGTVYITSASKSLNEVVVISRAAIVENKIDRVVYNVANDVTSQGGVATDVLKKVPQVTVDVDGNVELQGNSNIRFLINGKPSSMFGNSLSDALASIPASQIKSIEAITSPEAKYDAQGTGGIINIILKDNKMQGVNGNISLAAGTRLENGSVNLNVRHNNFGMNFFFSGNAQLKSSTPYSQDRTSADSIAKTSTRLLQYGNSDFNRDAYQSGLGFDWNISKTDNLSGSVSLNQFNNRLDGLTYQQQLINRLTNASSDTLNSLRQSDTRNHINAVDWNLAYKKKFKKAGQELDVLYSASYGSPSSRFLQSQLYDGQTLPYAGTSSSNPGNDRQHNISIDYVHPVNNKLTIETGLKTIFHDLSNTADVHTYDKSTNSYLPDPTQSYDFNYRMNIYAGYLSATFSMLNFLDVVAGARYEYTNIQMHFAGTTVPSYSNLVPSIILSHKFNKGQSFKLAYTHRLERPDRELNPFLNLSDPYNISTGNPALKPEIGDNFELGYNKSFDNGGSIYVALIERINSNDIKPYTTFYPSFQIGDSLYKNVSVTNRVNIGSEYNTGLIITGSLPLTKALNIRENLMVFNRHVVNKLDGGNQTNGLNWRLNMNVTYQLPKNLVAEAFGEYRSSFNNIQGRQPKSISYTFAFRKQFWNKNASIGLTATNPFNKYINQLTTIHTANYTSTVLRQIPYRSFGISLTYKFGKLQFKKEKENDNNYLNNIPSI
ncbi:outer membrane receptor protein involved in Fe transport [Chitinophaga niastensis]|uniref:Outer membrane receptor protein involved in Fe transport n=1 Tax=Chitinophaga niastensis TaxID=536980 RepID=A0A2P8HH88_CHINA|nr:TonB-dependent receptor [Chitinophaga niastensis]PSL45585.1 outer membrane receptor protein involved in Fe transport [Chitinophaga niastensis]